MVETQCGASLNVSEKLNIISPRKITAGFPGGPGTQKISDHPERSMNEWSNQTTVLYFTYLTVL